MTGPQPESENTGTRPISVAELLARNGTIGAPAVTRRRRRRRGDSDAITVAELTGELPIIRDEGHDTGAPGPANGSVDVAEPATPVADDEHVAAEKAKPPYWTEPEPRWPKSPPQPDRAGPQLSSYPRPPRRPEAAQATPAAERGAQPGSQSDAETMRPDPLDRYSDMPVDVMDAEVREAELETEDSAYVRSYLQSSDPAAGSDSTLFGGETLADEVARRRGAERSAGSGAAAGEADLDRGEHAAEAGRAAPAADAHPGPGKFESLWRGSLIVLQSILAVAFGAGLFIAFDQLWRWNSLVALVLSVLVILGLVAGVRVVRKTEDIASTLIAVAVGALITLGPLVLSLQSG
ncbi:hypothetical protein [Mycobacterium shigaense]|uniref:Uncharacterized protein n=1 Tax=Mycobacterium shigaense TaxID=722731 RepID=A0A1Z4ED62_9MYCO|nr:hypothetical protein [Mycobacterium shigaense]MEA1122258.1 hypothetical protein [Mycobacterium shigaense]PRI16939.1 hypothetical protein B2J96_00210 [Mycobacterium shigaense]BAX90878.1 hypothetical protein MSG_00714 [Mycobacterium shigaense]